MRDDWTRRERALRGQDRPGLRRAALQDPHEYVRRAALERLGEGLGPEDREVLLAALGDASDYNRGLAARTLGDLGDADAVPVLVASLAENRVSRYTAHGILAALGALGGPAARQVLVAHLEATRDPTTAFVCLEALERMADPACVEPLMALLEPRPRGPWRPHQLVRTLAALGDPRALPAVLGAVGAAGERAVASAAARLGTIETLAPRLRTRKRRLRRAVAAALGELGDPAAVGPLREAAARTRDAGFEGVLRRALARLGDRDADPGGRPGLLLAIEEGRLEQVRQAGAAAVPVLADAYRTADEPRRLTLLRTLTRMAAPEAVPFLLAVLAGPGDERVEEAARALGAAGDRRAVAALVARLRARRAEPRPGHGEGRGLVTALGALGDPAAVPVLAEVLAAEARPLAELAAVALGRIGGPEARAALRAGLGRPDVGVARAVAAALDALGWTPHDAVDRARLGVARGDWVGLRRLDEAALAFLAAGFTAQPRSRQEELARVLAGHPVPAAAPAILDWLFFPWLQVTDEATRGRWVQDLAPLLGSWAGVTVDAAVVLGCHEVDSSSRQTGYRYDLDRALAATARLAATPGEPATGLLRRVAGKRDPEVVTWVHEEYGGGSEPLDLEPQRRLAREALAARGAPPEEWSREDDATVWSRTQPAG